MGKNKDQKDCLFCKISRGEIPSKLVYSDERLFVCEDIAKRAPFHFLIIPRNHIATINDLSLDDIELIGEVVLTAKKIAIQFKFAESGYRLVINCNKDGGQEIFHIHWHLLAGKSLSCIG